MELRGSHKAWCVAGVGKQWSSLKMLSSLNRAGKHLSIWSFPLKASVLYQVLSGMLREPLADNGKGSLT